MSNSVWVRKTVCRTGWKNYLDEVQRTPEISASASTREVISPHVRTSFRMASNHFYTKLKRLKILPTRRTAELVCVLCFYSSTPTAHSTHPVLHARCSTAFFSTYTSLRMHPVSMVTIMDAPFPASLARIRSDGAFGKYDNYS
jgi:hypothetical protein